MMDGDAGSQVAVHDRFICVSRPFYQNHLVTGNGYGSTYGSKHAAMSARLNANIDASGREDRGDSAQGRTRGFEGFSFLAQYGLQNGSHAGKVAQVFERDKALPVRPADLRLDSPDETFACTAEKRRKQSLFNNPISTQQAGASRRDENSEDDPSSLALKLSFTNTEETANGTRNPKRFRPSSPGVLSPVCQVDDCHTDLKDAKDYHRRHKVCEPHSKAPQSLVQNVLQRFCQQCSRFHPLPEFDEGKRSCRRRLAGHNKRRRKTDAGANSEAVKNSDILSLVTILTQLQAVKGKEKQDATTAEYESILQNLRKGGVPLPLLTTALLREALAGVSQNAQTLSALQRSNQDPQAGVLGPLAGLSTDALLVMVHNYLTAHGTGSQGRIPSQQLPQQLLNSNQNSHALYSRGVSIPEDLQRNALANSAPFMLGVKSAKSSGESDLEELVIRPNITRQYLGQTASCSLEEDPESPPDSTDIRPLEEQNFFPIESEGGFRNSVPDMGNRRFSFQEDDLNLSPFSCRTDSAPGDDKPPNRQPSDSSDSGSDQSPSSSSSNGQELTGRIIFKLCDPQLYSRVTENEQSEIRQWLSLKPESMDAYLRPGCIMLTVFLSMPHRSWEELVGNLRGNLKRLVRLSQSDLWTSGRIVVQVGHQRALIVNGKVKRIRFLRTVRGPMLRSVRPLAVVAGEEATLNVCGYNLAPQTRIVCVYHGRYVLHEVPPLASEATGIESEPSSPRSNRQVERIRFPGGPPNVLGRCFIEVERDFMGNVLPVIVADKEICQELCSLEGELDSILSWQSEQSGDSSPDEARLSREAEAMNFLHELGWVFQSTSQGFDPCVGVDEDTSHISLSRFKGLLRYAVLRDWCAVVKKLLDLLFFVGIKETAEVLYVLSEVNLLHQAVKRKCRPMVELLLQFVPDTDDPKGHNIFTPIMEGPAGFTPLHIAASMPGAEDIIDALTEDPNEAGLQGWKSACDYAGRTPELYARDRGNLPYIELIERKLLSKRSPSVSITVFDMAQTPAEASMENSNQLAARSEISGSQDARVVELSSFARRGASTSMQACKDCRASARINPFINPYRSSRAPSRAYRPLMMMMVAVAAVCATVALIFKSAPQLESVMYSLKWEKIMYGPV